MEKVVFRVERNPYTKRNNFLAVFPDDSANPGRLGYVAFEFNGYNVLFEPYGEIATNYYYANTKRVRKNSPEADRCKRAIERYYNCQFRVMVKLR